MRRELALIAAVLVFGAFAFSTPVQEAAARDSAGCSTGGVRYQTGEVLERGIPFDGEDRRFLLYVPDSYDPAEATPLVFNLHGFASNPTQQMTASRWNEVADVENFIVVHPQGTGFPLRWAAYDGGRFAAMNLEPADDVGFIGAVIDTLTSEYCIDPARIYVSGLSNGAGMTHRIACELADEVAAIGTVAGAYPLPEFDPCAPSRPVPVIAFHGTEDPITPYEGEADFLPPFEEWVLTWAIRNGCDITSAEPEAVTENVTMAQYQECAASGDVVFYTIEGGGHTWPGGVPFPAFITGTTTDEINASELMWAFFEDHPMTGG